MSIFSASNVINPELLNNMSTRNALRQSALMEVHTRTTNKTFQQLYSGYRPLRSNTQYLRQNFSLRLSALWRKQTTYTEIMALALYPKSRVQKYGIGLVFFRTKKSRNPKQIIVKQKTLTAILHQTHGVQDMNEPDNSSNLTILRTLNLYPN
ncbi:hypothetical protein C1H46_016943 [Malus baccata]|uniref:Uncharacterized protein n=1 Tax=Malus baccata TaxID=106549 RepID=A0A540MF59_MALBA|nr:hypothetical protein C1H46_016943 [Malus baccata]